MQCSGQCSKLSASDFKHRVAFEATTQTSDNAGGFTEAWATVATVWAKIEPARAYERFVSMQTETHVTHKITCRYNSAIATAKRATYDSRTFDVTGIINVDEANQYMILTVVEGTL